jgi:hypothetical protein
MKLPDARARPQPLPRPPIDFHQKSSDLCVQTPPTDFAPRPASMWPIDSGEPLRGPARARLSRSPETKLTFAVALYMAFIATFGTLHDLGLVRGPKASSPAAISVTQYVDQSRCLTRCSVNGSATAPRPARQRARNDPGP